MKMAHFRGPNVDFEVKNEILPVPPAFSNPMGGWENRGVGNGDPDSYADVCVRIHARVLSNTQNKF